MQRLSAGRWGEGSVTGNSFFSIEKVPEARSGGATQAETRVYNERLIVSLVRRHGELSKVDLTRLTGLAPQTITTIVNRAAQGELLLRREPLRGRLGQPSVPYALNHDAAYAFGLKVGHRSADFALTDLTLDLATDHIVASAQLRNTGEVSGVETVQLFVRRYRGRHLPSRMELRDFERVTLAPGERQTVRFELAREEVGEFREDGRLVAEGGTLDIRIGLSAGRTLGGEIELPEAVARAMGGFVKGLPSGAADSRRRA